MAQLGETQSSLAAKARALLLLLLELVGRPLQLVQQARTMAMKVLLRIRGTEGSRRGPTSGGTPPACPRRRCTRPGRVPSESNKDTKHVGGGVGCDATLSGWRSVCLSVQIVIDTSGPGVLVPVVDAWAINTSFKSMK